MMQTLIGIAVIVMVPLGAVKWTGWYSHRCVQNARECIAQACAEHGTSEKLERLIHELEEVSGELKFLRQN